MKALVEVVPTPEQLAIFSRQRAGVEVIRGAAGSGKTTTAILKLQANIGSFVNRRRRQAQKEPIRILVLTFNRTLRGYVEELARTRVIETDDIEIEINTFGKWALEALGNPTVAQDKARERQIHMLGEGLGLGDYLIGEVDYAIGRFLPGDIEQYTTARRDGRGAVPRVDKTMREKIIAEVIEPYKQWLTQNNCCDWNDLAVELAETNKFTYDIVVVDEAQDFSGNQVRAVMRQLSSVHAVTFVLDTAQRIYARGFTWPEVGIVLRAENSHRLHENHRNTKQIAAFAASMLHGLAIDDDYTIPNFEKCKREGKKPIVLKGKYSKQLDYVLNYIKKNIDLTKDSVAFLQPKGGRWFDALRGALGHARLPFVEISRQSEWPKGTQNIALSTLHSAKGLEFDYVIILGLNAEVLPDGEFDGEDDRTTAARKLLAMGVSRARKEVILGYKEEEGSSLIEYFDKKTYIKRDV